MRCTACLILILIIIVFVSGGRGLAFGFFSPFPNFPHRARQEHPRSSISLVDHW